jgi:hypothetical protein
VEGQDRCERPADEVHEEEDGEKSDNAAEGHDRAEPRAGPLCLRPRTAALLVEGEDEDEGQGAQPGGHEERPTGADRVGEDAPRERPDGGGEDLRGLDETDGTPGLLARCLGRGHRQAEGTDAAEEADADPQDEELLDAPHGGGEGQEEDVGGEGGHDDDLVPVAVRETPPDGGEEPGEEGGDADEDTGPEGRPLGLVDAELPHEQGKEGQDEGEAGEDDKDHRDRDEQVAACGRDGHESSQTSPIA